MNAPLAVKRHASVCPHDCPSVCALDVEIIDGQRIGRVYGAKDQRYTAGVVCAKVARYAERIHHPDRLTQPLKRVGPKGSGQFAPIGWDEAMERTAEAFLKAERQHGAESVWPYFYAGTMGLVMRDGIERLTHAKGYSRFYGTICVGISWPAYVAGTGALLGADPREIPKSDCVVIWGTNAVATQVNLMTHVTRARKNGAKIVAIDIYETETLRQADSGPRAAAGHGRRARPARSCTSCSATATPTGTISAATPTRPRRCAIILRRARPHGPARSPGSRRNRSRPSRRWSGGTRRRSSAWAMASRASATARRICTPRSRSPP